MAKTSFRAGVGAAGNSSACTTALEKQNPTPTPFLRDQPKFRRLLADPNPDLLPDHALSAHSSAGRDPKPLTAAWSTGPEEENPGVPPGLVPSQRDTSGFSRCRPSPLPPYSRPPLRDARGPPASGSALNPPPSPLPPSPARGCPRPSEPTPSTGGGARYSPAVPAEAGRRRRSTARLGAGLGTAPAPPRGGTAGTALSPAPRALRGA